MIVRELLTKLGFDVDSGQLRKYENETNAAVRATRALVLVSTAAVAGLALMAVESANYAKEIDLANRSTHEGTTELQQWGFIAKRLNVDFGTVVQTMQHLGREAGNVLLHGGGALRAFFIAGAGGDLSKSPGKLFEAVLTGLSKIKNENLRAAIGTQLLGEGYQKLLPLIQQGPGAIKKWREEFEALGLAISEDGIKQLSQLSDNFKTVRDIVTSVRNGVSAELAPALNGIILKFIEWWKVNKDLVKGGITEFLKTLGTVLGIVWKGIVLIGHGLNFVLSIFGGFNNALKLFLLLWASFKAAEIIIGIVEIGVALFSLQGIAQLFMGTLSTMIKLFTFAASPVVLLTASLFALVLAIQDIYTWMRGGNSLTGHLLGTTFHDFQKQLDFTWSPERGFSLGKNFATSILEGMKSIFTSGIGDAFKALGTSMWSSFEGGINAFGYLARGVAWALPFLAADHSNALGPLPGVGSPLPGRGGQTITVSAPVTISLPGVTDPSAFADAFANHVEAVLSQRLQRDFVQVEPTQ